MRFLPFFTLFFFPIRARLIKVSVIGTEIEAVYCLQKCQSVICFVDQTQCAVNMSDLLGSYQ